MGWAPLRFPDPAGGADRVGVELCWDGRFPFLRWAGLLRDRTGPVGSAPPSGGGFALPLLGEHAHGVFTRPGLRGHGSGRSWSTRFETTAVHLGASSLAMEALDAGSGLVLTTEVEALEGGALRARHSLANAGADPYTLDGLEVLFPLDERCTEVVDLTGRHELERTPQRHALADGLWLREQRRGKPGFDAATLTMVGTPGMGFEHGQVVGLHVAWSGSSVVRVERDPDTGATVGGGELLLPGEVVLGPGDTYTTPWVHLAASSDGIDGLSAQLHTWLRSRPAHPRVQPVTLNVWEAVWFDHRPDRLATLATLAAEVGVERFVLDDGWFHGRRDDGAGLGDWWVDTEVWPDGLDPLIAHVRSLGMEFGLWFEPEMVNPRSELFRTHPDWVLGGEGPLPLLSRNQLVLDLGRPEVRDHLLDRVSTLLHRHDIAAVKWDHNRDLLEAAGGAVGGRPGVHAQTVGFYLLLDALRAAHPHVAWESCAGGGGRIDLEVLERASRVWTSDNTDALARQRIQRWTSCLVPPEYLGAHVSAPVSHQTGRALPLDFRAATALFGAFGIEWDLGAATPAERLHLATWVERYKALRPLLHSGRVVRPDSPDPAVLLHGVVAADRSEALMAHVQMAESAHERGTAVRVPGLDALRRYRVRRSVPPASVITGSRARRGRWSPDDDEARDGASLGAAGVWVPRTRPHTVTLLHVCEVEP